ncbi:hypothetical protein HDU91_000131, partial [Kappamyces sp. JEL0680]
MKKQSEKTIYPKQDKNETRRNEARFGHFPQALAQNRLDSGSVPFQNRLDLITGNGHVVPSAVANPRATLYKNPAHSQSSPSIVDYNSTARTRKSSTSKSIFSAIWGTVEEKDPGLQHEPSHSPKGMVPASTSRPASINGPEVSLFGSMLRSFKANTSGTNKRASGLSLFSNGHHEKIAEEPVSSRAPLSFENSRLVVQELRDWESLSLRELGLGETSPQSMEEQVLAPMTQAVSPRTTSLVLATMPRSTSLARGNDSGKLRSAPSPDTNTDFVYVSPSSIMTVDRRIFQPESSTPKEQQFGTTPRARTWSAPPPLSPSSLDAATLAANSPATDDIPMATSPVQVQDAQGMSVVSDSVLYDGG